MKTLRHRLLLGTVAVLCAGVTPIAAAQAPSAGNFPSKSIRMIVYSAPGGSNDIFARVIANKLNDRLPQRTIVDNRPGADGIIGTQIAMRAPADGYTLLMVSTSYTVHPAVRDTPYNPASLMPIAQVALGGNVIATHPVFPAKTVKELIAIAKAKPQALRYASSAGFNLLSAELFNIMAGVRIERIPYQGGNPSMLAVMTGEVEMLFGSMIQALPHMRSGRLKALGIGSPKRSPMLPELPTIAETIAGYDGSIWWGILAPTGVPAPIVSKLNAEINTVLRDPDLAKHLAAEAAEPLIATPEAFGKLIASDLAKWSRVAKQANIRAE